ncbi:MAG: homoserine dehydrogenase [Chloroflexi bacterium]|nr:homoserine dehydrogenase [Chloroflexota bacterium]|tara:strand:- start:3425 stop:4723 length:1299 start_codon:yes stop_codon:yes gene_type:complete
MVRSRLNIGIIGIGNIGLEVFKQLISNSQLSELFSIESVLVRDIKKYTNIISKDIGFENKVDIALEKLTDSEDKFFSNNNIDVIIELIGGLEPAYSFVKRALEYKKHVVTANKDLIATHIEELIKLSKKNNVKLRFEGSVGAGIPIIEVLSDMLKQNQIQKITGIINGTSNYILSSMFENSSNFENVLKEAQELGFAESDPTNDVEGFDAKFKIDILGSIAFGSRIPLKTVYVKGISEISNKDMNYAREFGYNIKLLAITERKPEGIYSSVSPALVSLAQPMSKVGGNYNAVEILGDLVGNLWIQGEGAGKNSTSSAVLGDLMGIYYGSNDDINLSKGREKYLTREEIILKNYIRLSVEDKYGVLSEISGIFSNNEISIASVIQKDIDNSSGVVDLVIMTHDSKGINFDTAIDSVSKISSVKEKPIIIRIND